MSKAIPEIIADGKQDVTVAAVPGEVVADSAVTTDQAEKLLDLVDRGNCMCCPYFRPYDGMIGWWGMVGRCNALQGLADHKAWWPFPWQKLARYALARIAWTEMTDHCQYKPRAEAKNVPYDYGEEHK